MATKKSSLFVEQYGPWALVAGASVGLGEAFARDLAKRGLNIVLVSRRHTVLETLGHELQKNYGVQIRVVAQDLGAPDAAEQIETLTQDITVGLLVYNAALPVIGRFLEQPIEMHLQSIDVNCRAPLSLCHLYGNQMVSRGRGGIVLMSSLSGMQGCGTVANYAATKAYNRVLAEGLWHEFSGKGVDVIACLAGVTRTPGYLSSNPKIKRTAMEPAQVVTETLAALGRKPSFVPGILNKLIAFLMSHLVPRRLAIRIIGDATGAMYLDKGTR
jgi:short-subunit dehydrogenase